MGLVHFSPFTFRAGSLFVVGELPGHCRMLSSFLDFTPLDGCQAQLWQSGLSLNMAISYAGTKISPR